MVLALVQMPAERFSPTFQSNMLPNLKPLLLKPLYYLLCSTYHYLKRLHVSIYYSLHVVYEMTL